MKKLPPPPPSPPQQANVPTEQFSFPLLYLDRFARGPFAPTRVQEEDFIQCTFRCSIFRNVFNKFYSTRHP